MTKKIPYTNEKGERIEPISPNGYKYEMIAFDLMTKLGSAMAFEADRASEFAPIKNLTGEDSVDSARALLRQNGIEL
jgi:UDP-N-acetylglucosamine/UDP-N-acetylgalactosamine diphosphorylase